MSKFRNQSCFMSDLATAAKVSAETFRGWLTEADLDAMRALGHREGDRKLKPRVVNYLIDKYVPGLE